MEEEGLTNAVGHKVQKDIAHIGTHQVLKVSLKIFERHAKELVTPVSQVLVILSSVLNSAWALFLLVFLDHKIPLPGGFEYQRIMPASPSGIDEGKESFSGLLVVMINWGLISVVLSLWQYRFTRVVGGIYSGENVPHSSPFPFKQLMITEVWTSLILHAILFIFVLSFRFVVLSFYHQWSWILLTIALVTAAVSAFGLVAGVLISQLGTVVCLVANCCSENVFGRAAVMKALMVLRGRWKVALGLAAIHSGAVFMIGSNLLRPGFGVGRVLVSAFQILLLSVWRQLAFLCWVVLYISCRAFQHEYIDWYAPHLDKEKTGDELHTSAL